MLQPQFFVSMKLEIRCANGLYVLTDLQNNWKIYSTSCMAFHHLQSICFPLELHQTINSALLFYLSLKFGILFT